MAVVLVGVVWVSTNWLAPNPAYGGGNPPFPGSWLLAGWFRYDGGWYYLIAREGYYFAGPDVQSSVAFFPAYPLAMRAVAVVVGNEILAGMLITAVAGLGMTVLLYRWTLERFGESAARWTMPTLLLYPWSWYLFGAVYADALFLVATLGAFMLDDRDRPLLAGLVAIVATAARPVGVAVVFGLLVVVLERRLRESPVAAGGGLGGLVARLRAIRPRDAGVLVSLAGLGSWSTYLWWRWQDPLLFGVVQGAPGWDQEPGLRTWFKVSFFGKVRRLPDYVGDVVGGTTTTGPNPLYSTVYTSAIVLQALAIAVALALVWLVWKRIGWGYALYCVAVLGIPLLSTKDFQGVGRYVLAAFPCFAVAGALLAERPRARLPVLCAGAALLVLLTSLYARGYYVA